MTDEYLERRVDALERATPAPPLYGGTPNGNGKGLWMVAGVCSSVVLAIGAIVERAYARDRAELMAWRVGIEVGITERAANLAMLLERVEHIRYVAEANRILSDSAVIDLNTKVSQQARREDLEELRRRLDLSEALLREIREEALTREKLEGQLPPEIRDNAIKQ